MNYRCALCRCVDQTHTADGSTSYSLVCLHCLTKAEDSLKQKTGELPAISGAIPDYGSVTPNEHVQEAIDFATKALTARVAQLEKLLGQAKACVDSCHKADGLDWQARLLVDICKALDNTKEGRKR